MILAPVDEIADLFGSAAAEDYLGEPVTILAHLLQAGALAEAAGAPPALVAAALLHDIGHLPGVGDRTGQELMAGTDKRHGAQGAAWLAQWYPPSVTEPIRLHVPAKRYLCAVEPSYFALLSEASVYTLSVQGGPMTEAEAREFESLQYANDAVAVRRWDDRAKDPFAEVPGFDHYRAPLERLAGAG
jgi:phosphonate degradation associated HDIG domain protein